MTVCVAAIYENNAVLGAADRMITSGGHIEFQPPQPKIWPITSAITAMVADDISVHAAIHQEILGVVNERIQKEPQNWWKVKDIADLYCQSYHRLRSKAAADVVLSPFGLNLDTFIKRQQEMTKEFIDDVSYRLKKYEFGGASTIIAGIDAEGPHIYTVNDGNVSCKDRIGFAVIGVGYWHAASHLMFSGHSRNNSGERTLLLVHQAKRKSEVAPGVGRETDMFLAGPRLGTFFWITKEWIDQLDKIYESYLRQNARLNKKVEGKFKTFVEEQAKKQQTQQQKPTDLKPTDKKPDDGLKKITDEPAPSETNEAVKSG